MPRTFVNTTNVGDTGWGPPLVDEDWHATLSSHLPRRRATLSSHLPRRRRGKNGRLWTTSTVDEMARQVEKLTTTEVVGNTSKNRSAVAGERCAFEKTHSCAGRAFATHGEWSGNGGEERSVNIVS